MAAPDRVSVDAAGLDLRTPATLDRVIKTENQWPLGSERIQQLPQEHQTGLRGHQRGRLSTRW